MGCDVVQQPGFTAIVCRKGARRCRWCGLPSTKLCDWKGLGQTKTCDAPMCDTHATPVGRNLDHCPDHVAAPRAEAR